MKAKQMKTPVGIVKVGDTVELSWEPNGNKGRIQKISEIYDEDGEFSLAFYPNNDYGSRYDYNGHIEDSILRIIPNKITNWQKEMEN